MIEIEEIDAICKVGQLALGNWIYKDDSLNTYRGVSQQLYAQMMGWA